MDMRDRVTVMAFSWPSQLKSHNIVKSPEAQHAGQVVILRHVVGPRVVANRIPQDEHAVRYVGMS
jgi:hypothetical protein